MISDMVSLVLVNWNGKRFLPDCLRSVQSQSYQHRELILIDNASTDGSPELLRTWQDQAQVFLNETNRGYCGGANQGIGKARGEYILLMNPDVILAPDFVEILVRAAQADNNIGSLSGKLLRFDRTTLDSTGQFLRRDYSPLERGYGEDDQGQYDASGWVFSVCGAVAFYRRAMLEDVQVHGEVFDEAYFAFYEDLDLGWRAQLYGWRAYYAADAVAYHYRGGGIREQQQQLRWFERLPGVPKVSFVRKPVFIQRHVMLNRYLTLGKNATWPELLLGLPWILKTEVLLWTYVLCLRPSLLAMPLALAKSFPLLMKKRRVIQERRSVSAAYIRGYIQGRIGVLRAPDTES